ncbi:hypothetical protein V6L77_14340 [Pannonibacter sp. Pt2-lr]|uniref:Flagellar assembly protein FliH/Type III secretion system HrpE domain-containing protein n=1 Tax=Pannonibacter anstelovis TaxID=3121537 RepID=A0ABU7ZT60_9HYPH
MTPKPIASRLPVLSSPVFQHLSSAEVIMAEVMPVVERAPEPTIEERLAAEYARGVRAGREEARLAAAEDLEVQVTALRSEAAAAREAFEEEQARQLSDGIANAVASLSHRMSDAVEQVLLPFLEHAVRDQAVSHFSATLQELLTGRSAVFEVSGPSALLDRVMHQLGPLAGSVTVRQGDTPELQAVLGDTIIETQMADWLRRLKTMRETEE